MMVRLTEASRTYRVFADYRPEDRQAMARLLDAARLGPKPDMDDIERRLKDVIFGLELAYADEDEIKVWREIHARKPSAAEMSDALNAAAAADDPIAAAEVDRRLRSWVNAKIRASWFTKWKREHRDGDPSLRVLDWDSLTESERNEFREMLVSLATDFRQLVSRGRATKSTLDKALEEIADIYLRAIDDWTTPMHGVSYSPNSRFMRFAALALEPAGEYFEVSLSALSSRWYRLAKSERSADAAADAVARSLVERDGD